MRFEVTVRVCLFVGMLVLVAICGAWTAKAAGALAVGKCGAYGHAFDYGNEQQAVTAARAQCKGSCETVTMKKACAAFSVDMANPCGASGFAVARHISGAQNTAMKNCYKFGGKECVIRTWACDAKG